MKEQAKPLYLGIAALFAVVVIFLLYRNFLAEAPLPKSPSREEEMKFKGIQSENYQKTYQQQYQKNGGQRQ